MPSNARKVRIAGGLKKYFVLKVMDVQPKNAGKYECCGVDDGEIFFDKGILIVTGNVYTCISISAKSNIELTNTFKFFILIV